MINLTMYRGDTAYWDFRLKGPSGEVLNPAGATIWFTAKTSKSISDVSATFQKKTGNGVTVLDSATGLIRVQLDSGDTSTIVGKAQLFWDLQVKDIAGGVYTVADGILSVNPDVTQSIV